MPWQVKWVCIGLNVLMTVVIGFISIFSFATGGFWLGVFFGVWAAVAAYSAYEMNKVRLWFRRQTSAPVSNKAASSIPPETQ